MDGSLQEALLCSDKSSILIAVADQSLRQQVVDLLEQIGLAGNSNPSRTNVIPAAVAIEAPDLVILDTGDLARFCRERA